MEPYIVKKKFKSYTDVLYFLLGVDKDCNLTGVSYSNDVFIRTNSNDYKVIIKIY